LGLKLRPKLKQLPFPQLQNFRKNNKTLGWKTPLNVEGVKKGVWGLGKWFGKSWQHMCTKPNTHFSVHFSRADFNFLMQKGHAEGVKWGGWANSAEWGQQRVKHRRTTLSLCIRNETTVVASVASRNCKSISES